MAIDKEQELALEVEEARKKFWEKLKEILPQCPACGSEGIKPKFGSYLGSHTSKGDHPYESRVEFLYCSNCGRVHFTGEVQAQTQEEQMRDDDLTAAHRKVVRLNHRLELLRD